MELEEKIDFLISQIKQNRLNNGKIIKRLEELEKQTNEPMDQLTSNDVKLLHKIAEYIGISVTETPTPAEQETTEKEVLVSQEVFETVEETTEPISKEINEKLDEFIEKVDIPNIDED